MKRGQKIWIGGVGVGVELIFVAAVALGVPAAVWVLALLIGAALILVALFVGEPPTADQPTTRNKGDGGGGAGDVRGNVFGDHATVMLGPSSPGTEATGSKSLISLAPKDLLGFFQEHTSVQAEKLAEPYIGGWIKVGGTVFNVDRSRTFGDDDDYRVSINLDDCDALVFACFIESAQEHLPRLRRGDSITVVGQISEVDGFVLQLAECELLPIER